MAEALIIICALKSEQRYMCKLIWAFTDGWDVFVSLPTGYGKSFSLWFIPSIDSKLRNINDICPGTNSGNNFTSGFYHERLDERIYAVWGILNFHYWPHEAWWTKKKSEMLISEIYENW